MAITVDDSRAARVIRSRLDRPLVLIGMMGSGKSRLGRMLADVLGLSFADSDEEIEKAAGCSIADIFERYGEPFFRDREARVIERLIDEGTGVVSTGGGAVMQPGTAARIWSETLSIWVRADIGVLVERTSRNGGRPLLKGGDPAAILSKLLAERESTYARADVTVHSHGGLASQNLAEALGKLEDFLLARGHDEGGDEDEG